VFKVTLLHPECGAQVGNQGIHRQQRGQGALHCYPSKPTPPCLTRDAGQEEAEMKRGVSEGCTEVAELRWNVSVHTCVAASKTLFSSTHLHTDEMGSMRL